ncbi:MAG: prohibitin family protein [bacterium]|nr:prohibitin family protein [bacterium]
MNKKLAVIGAGLATVAVVILGFSCMEKIQPGYVGIVYNLKGGIEDELLTQGLHIVSPFKKINSYSVATEQAYLSRDEKEGSEDDDSFTIPTSDGKTVNVDLEFSYHFDSEVLPQTFTTFKGQSGYSIEQTFIRGKIKAWTSEVSSTFSVIDIYGEKRAELNSKVLEHVKEKFSEYGIIIDSVNFSRISLDEQTEEAIQQRINKQQELETAKLESQKATIEAEKKKIQAEADAQAKIIAAEAEAKANKLLEQSITDELIRMKEAEARLQHGWVTVQGADAVVVDKK